MKALLCVALLVALCAACIAAEAASPLDRELGDGWYAWRVERVAGARCRCCSGLHDGDCGLESDGRSVVVSSDRADTRPGTLRVFAKMRSGRPVQLRVFGPGCRVTAQSSVTDLGVVDADRSIGWLSRYIEPRNAISSELIEAINSHASDRSVSVLTGIVKTGHNFENRKEALFWLAQSDSQPAFDFLDRLLTREP